LTPALLPACPKPGPERKKNGHIAPLDPGPLLQGCKTVVTSLAVPRPRPASTSTAELSRSQIKAAPLHGTASGAPRAGLSLGRPAQRARAVPLSSALI